MVRRVIHVVAVPLFVLLALTGCAGPNADRAPIAPVRPVVDVYHGTSITDPYRYMENLKDPEVQTWIKGQADYTRRVLDTIPGRDALLARIQELDTGAAYRIWIERRKPDGTLYYIKTMANENVGKFYVRDGRTGQERLLIDPEKLAQGTGTHYSLSFAVDSPDGKYIAYGLAAAGSEQTTLRVLDVASGKDLPDVIDRMEADYTPPYWLEDGSGFVYSRRQKLGPGAPPTDGYKHTRAYLHRLGSNPDNDPLLVAVNTSPAVQITEVDFPSIILPTGSTWAILKIKHGDANELTLFSAPVTSLTLPKEQIPWRKICDAGDEVEEFSVHGDEIYLVTASSAPRYRVVRVPLARPDFAAAQAVVPAGQMVVESVTTARDALYVILLDNGIYRTGRIPYASGEPKMEMLGLPRGESSIVPIVAEQDVDGVLLASASWTKAGRIYAYDPATRSMTDTQLRPRGKFDDVEGFESHEVMVTSHDGVRVPLSIIHKKGIKLDGSHPTLVRGYGGYGIRMDPGFDPISLAWLERGGVFAVAHVRGGGELGKEWHHAGRKQTKPNTWKDFLACCEYLIQKGYTSPGKLAGQGGSAGGILIGRAITERPDIFAAALIQVGCTDMLRMETTTNGVPNIPEFGTVKTKEGYDGLLAMSAYAHVKDGARYPAVLLTHGINDPRVEPWMSAKMTARLQAATASGKPVLFRVDYEAGHGIGSTRTQARAEWADSWAFLLWQMGESGFSKP